jgi:hypothetical protein
MADLKIKTNQRTKAKANNPQQSVIFFYLIANFEFFIGKRLFNGIEAIF